MQVCLTRVNKAHFIGQKAESMRVGFLDDWSIEIASGTLNIWWVRSKIEALVLREESGPLKALVLSPSFFYDEHGMIAVKEAFCAFIPNEKGICVQECSGSPNIFKEWLAGYFRIVDQRIGT